MNIGIEIEFTGVTVKQVAYALESLWGKPYTELKQKFVSHILVDTI